ncbi:hypothetical protein [Nitratireductor basaltis]|uniref:Uncharacterized protein n=1 Tax=Nitratireductor basaltis TaxID=472175 RepID=A0A084UDE8_9HYPH|nr:hypothetical protein [Nitratireductor basaltis]KFB10984.1 hypothetical protein EL18_02025 [Nitratireductor basaltis]
MPLQNRADPYGVLHAVEARGIFTGNRGVIHDPYTRRLLKRRWTTQAWIICSCSFRNRRRDVMGFNGRSGRAGWTEIFFLDEVSALAAGHRPCFYCRRDAASSFARAFAAGQGEEHMSAPKMDGILHVSRCISAPNAERAAVLAEDLPDGALVEWSGRPHAKRGSLLLGWSFQGYGDHVMLSDVADPLPLITPPATLLALRAGFAPVWHPTAHT